LQLVNAYLSVVAVQTFEKNVFDGVGYIGGDPGVDVYVLL